MHARRLLLALVVALALMLVSPSIAPAAPGAAVKCPKGQKDKVVKGKHRCVKSKPEAQA